MAVWTWAKCFIYVTIVSRGKLDNLTWSYRRRWKFCSHQVPVLLSREVTCVQNSYSGNLDHKHRCTQNVAGVVCPGSRSMILKHLKDEYFTSTKKRKCKLSNYRWHGKTLLIELWSSIVSHYWLNTLRCPVWFKGFKLGWIQASIVGSHIGCNTSAQKFFCSWQQRLNLRQGTRLNKTKNTISVSG